MARPGTAWSVKGIDTKTRGIARLRAGEAGLNIGAWVDQAILAQARREADPEGLAFELSAKTPLIDSLGAMELASRGPGGDLVLLAMIDQELEASRLRVDESLRPFGFALRDLALQLVAAELLQSDGTARKAPDSRLEQPVPGTEGLFPLPPSGSLAPLIGPDELTPPSKQSSDRPTDPPAYPIPVAPPAPTGDLRRTISDIKEPPLRRSSRDTLFEQAELPAPPGPEPIPALLPAEDPPGLLEPPRNEARFTGLRGGFESDPQHATIEARKATRLQSRRMLRIAAGLVSVLFFATATAAYLFAESLGIGVVRDNLRSVAAQHIDAAGKTFRDAYHAADQKVADLLKTTTARDVEASSMDRGPKQRDQANTDADSAANPRLAPSIMVAPKPNKRAQSARKQPKLTALLTPALKTARTERVTPIRLPHRANSDERTVGAGLPAAPSVDRRAGRADQEVGGILELRRRARAGDASARHQLARRLIQGDGVEQNFSEGADWFREAAIQGVANAQYNLGVLYERGLGVTRNDVRALLWYHSAAEQSHPLAQYNLGNFYLRGRGIPLSYAEAVRWFKAASNQGVAEATYNLGVLTEDGLGVPSDLAKALSLYEKAAASGHQDSVSRLTMLRDPGAKGLKPATFADTADTQARVATIGSTVAGIQAILQRQGIYVGRIDGIAGPGTRTAIRAYQQLHTLAISGIPSEFLLDYMKTSESAGAKPVAG